MMVLSTIAPVSAALNYGGTRSIYSADERLAQTVKTVESVRKYLPDADILVCDNSEKLPEKTEQSLIKAGATYFNNEHTNLANSPHKAIGEAQCSTAAYKFLATKGLLNTYTLFLKLSGRYCLNDEFQLENFSNFPDNKTTFTFLHPIPDAVSTVLYSFKGESLQEWKSMVDAITKSGSTAGYERLIFSATQGKSKYINRLGAEGRVTNGDWFKA